MGYHYSVELEAVERRNAMLQQATGMWDWSGGQCMWCGGETGRRHHSHCNRRLCRAIDRYYSRGGGSRREYMHGRLFPLYIIAGYLRVIATSRGAAAREFSKRYAHRRPVSRREQP